MNIATNLDKYGWHTQRQIQKTIEGEKVRCKKEMSPAALSHTTNTSINTGIQIQKYI